MLAEDIIYCGFTCIVCNSFHAVISKSLIQCIYCGVLTLNKEMIGPCCLNCLSKLDASCCNFNIYSILLTYQLISKISYENYRNLNGLCRSCNSIPDVFMVGQHWSCYTCIFSCMELGNCIRCQYGCCYIEKKLVLESSFPIQKIDQGFSSVTVFENRGEIRDAMFNNVSPSSSVIYIQGQYNSTITHCQELHKIPQQTITNNGLHNIFSSNSVTTIEIQKAIPMPHPFKDRKIMS